MSRLFSRLENKGQDPDDGTSPAYRSEADRPEYAGVDAGVFVSTSSGSDLRANALPGQLPAMQPLVPGYAIASSPGMAVPSTPVVTRPIWPVWLWLASLLFLLGLSLLILALPERLLPLTTQPPAAVALPTAAPAPAIAPVPTPVARAGGASMTSPAANALPTPVRTAEPLSSPAVPAPAAAVAPVAPAGPSGNAACSEAMLAMNLCSKSSP